MRGFDGLVVVALLIAIGAGVVFFEFLDSHQWVVTGSAGLVTAVATAYLARFSYATVRLFRLRQKQQEATQARLQSEAAQILAAFLESQEELEFALVADDPFGSAFRRPVAESLGHRLRVYEDRMSTLEEEGVEVGANWVRYFRQAQRLARNAREEFETLKRVADKRRESDSGVEIEPWPPKFFERLENALEPLVTHLASKTEVNQEAEPLVTPAYRVED